MIPKLKETHWDIRPAGENGFTIWCKGEGDSHFLRVGGTFPTIDGALAEIKARRMHRKRFHRALQGFDPSSPTSPMGRA